MGNPQSKVKEKIIINENINSQQQNMDINHTIKIDTFFIICFIIVIYILYRINIYFKNYVNKKAIIQA